MAWRWMFFLPLAVSDVHILLAYPIISRRLVLFGNVDARPFFTAMIIVVLTVALLYYAVYRVTSGISLKIIQDEAGSATESRVERWSGSEVR